MCVFYTQSWRYIYDCAVKAVNVWLSVCVYASGSISPWQPGFPLIDALSFPCSASFECQPSPSQTTRDSLFVISELVCGFGYEKRGQARGWQHRNWKTSKHGAQSDYWNVTLVLCSFSRLSVWGSSTEIKMTVRMINGHLTLSTCLPLSPFCTPYTSCF